jgi:hypothetical protein
MEDEKPKYLMLKFSGDKTELHTQLKAWCALSNKTMGGTIIELIEQLLEAQKQTN